MHRRPRGNRPDRSSGAPRRAPGGGSLRPSGEADVGRLGPGVRVGVAAGATVLVVLALRFAGGAMAPAEAVQPYAPRGLAVTQVAASDWFALSVRASGFRPNSTVLVDIDGVGQRSMAVDAAGVVDLRVELPDTVGVQVRGIALEGGGLDLRQEVGLVRPDRSVRDLLLGALGLSVVAGVVLGPGLRARLGRVRPADDAPVARPGTA